MSRTECSVHDDNANRVHEITAGSMKYNNIFDILLY